MVVPTGGGVAVSNAMFGLGSLTVGSVRLVNSLLSEPESDKSKLSLPASPLLSLGRGDAVGNQATHTRRSPSEKLRVVCNPYLGIDFVSVTEW